MSVTTENWTNKSIKKMAGAADPVGEITRRAREIVLDAMDNGWSGPPFDPLKLGDFLKLRVVPKADIRDARTVSENEGFCIEYNPTRPRERLRYSIAHEIAHTLFPDCADRVRNRLSPHEMRGDDWQLEALCNIAAAEFLMPMGSLGPITSDQLNIDSVLELRKKYDVSTEAVLLRAVHATEAPCAAFAVSRADDAADTGRFRVDYVIPSRESSLPVARGMEFSADIVGQCSAIGFTAKGTQEIGGQAVKIECVGIPAYPGSSFPRVAGIFTSESGSSILPRITFLRGDATQPRGEGSKLVVQVVNDSAVNWSGSGFARAVKGRWPEAQSSFRAWSSAAPRNLSLGTNHVADVSPDIGIVSMICQKGFGPSAKARLRYSALEACLRRVAEIARERSASVHMPKIGCGQAGGTWFLVQELIASTLLESNVPVFVYELPDQQQKPAIQKSLTF